MESPYPILANVTKPTDLHGLNRAQLHGLAADVRKAILDNVSRTGGHLSSNLGTVELTVALYGAYHVPPDIVVWDTGHQAYPHKLLTGRLDRIETLRKFQGLSGFLRREEHELDVFGAGHAGTAVSAALGFAAARDKLGQAHSVVAVAGDAAICSGMSWEALNHGGEMGTNITVVLNDNRMSIAPNVGALTSYFTRLRARPLVQDLAYRAKHVIEKIPGPAPRLAAGLRHGLTHYFAPEDTGTIFEEMGWEYIGPVDGHDLDAMLDIFRAVRESPRPVLVHALTVKGKGYDVAEADSRKWHGVVPFDVDSQELPSKAGPVAYTQVFGKTIVELAEEDDAIVAITAAMPDGTGLNAFQERFPDRIHDVGIAEQHAVTFAAGLAAGGVKPFCAIYSTFLQRGFDQVLHDVCIQNLPVRFVMDRGGLVGDDGPTHHGVFDHSYLGLIPNLVLMAPRDATELREMLRWMADYSDGPSAIRYPRGAASDVLPEARSPVRIGRWEMLDASGSDKGGVALIGSGSTVAEVWQAASMLDKNGIRATTANARFIKPIDVEMARDIVSQHELTVVVEENVRSGGLGQQVIDACRQLDRRIEVLSVPDRFVEHGSQAQLRSLCGIGAAEIAEFVHAQLPERAIRGKKTHKAL
ncbi:MAG: 1-deoxy-D-xylulose-5-phosphate synthase [Fimbriimonadaceae bacterium]